MGRTVIAALAAALLPSAAGAFVATDGELSQRILGTWGETPACDGGMLAFAGDGTFSFSYPNGVKMSGTWSISGGVLSGTWNNGNPQPDASIAFGGGDATLTMTDPGSGAGGTYHRCDDPPRAEGSPS